METPTPPRTLASPAQRIRDRLNEVVPLLKRFISADLAIDLGTSNTLAFTPDRGVIFNEPSVVAVDERSQRIVAVGTPAKAMLGRTPEFVKAIRPLRDGVIADFDATEALLRNILQQAQNGFTLMRPRVIIAIPSGTTAVERRAVKRAAELAGARKVYLIAEAVAAAIGAGLPIAEARGSLVVDIGGGTTEIAITALSGVVVSRSLRVGGNTLDDAITGYLKRKHDLLVGPVSAEMLKIHLACAIPEEPTRKATVSGRDLLSGMPKRVEVSSDDILEPLQEPLESLLQGVHDVLESCPPQLAADLLESRAMLTGGGALLPGLDRLLSKRIGLEVELAADPLTAVVRGCGDCLSQKDLLERFI